MKFRWKIQSLCNLMLTCMFPIALVKDFPINHGLKFFLFHFSRLHMKWVGNHMGLLLGNALSPAMSYKPFFPYFTTSLDLFHRFFCLFHFTDITPVHVAFSWDIKVVWCFWYTESEQHCSSINVFGSMKLDLTASSIHGRSYFKYSLNSSLNSNFWM